MLMSNLNIVLNMQISQALEMMLVLEIEFDGKDAHSSRCTTIMQIRWCKRWSVFTKIQEEFVPNWIQSCSKRQEGDYAN